MKYKAKDKVKIIKNTCVHQFTIGSIVTIIDVYTFDYKAVNDLGHWWWITDDDIEIVKTNKMNNNTKQAIKKEAETLLKANNTVTTLEIKVALRKRYPIQNWVQSDISKVMDELAANNLYTYTYNGVYRVYSLVKNPKTVNVKTQKATALPKTVNVKSQRVSRTKVLELIQNNGGRFFGVTFTKKDGSTRDMKCKIEKHNTTPTPFGYLLVTDVINDTPKNLNLQTISELRMNKNVYKVN